MCRSAAMLYQARGISDSGRKYLIGSVMERHHALHLRQGDLELWEAKLDFVDDLFDDQDLEAFFAESGREPSR